MPYGGFWGAPEDGGILTEQVRFIQKRLKINQRFYESGADSTR